MGLIEKIIGKAIHHYYASVAAHPQARDWYYNLYHVLEGDAEVPNVPTAAGVFADPWIEQRFERHASDERRHQGLWRDLLHRRAIYRPDSIPAWANVVAKVFDSPWFAARDDISGHRHVHPQRLIAMFAAMHALEVLGVQRFQIMAELHRTLDPEIAHLLDVIVRDERFHTAYTRESALRLGRSHQLEDYAERCLKEGVQAYQRLGLTILPQFVRHLRGLGVRFSPWFLLLNRVFAMVGAFAPGLKLPPQLAQTRAAGIAHIPPVAVVVSSPAAA